MSLVELTDDWSVLVNWSVLVLTRRVARSVFERNKRVLHLVLHFWQSAKALSFV